MKLSRARLASIAPPAERDEPTMKTNLANLFHELVRLETELWSAVDNRLQNDHDLALTWFEPMQIIERTPGCRVLDIADDLSVTVGGVSKVVDRIEAAGWCRRRPNPDYGRSSIITLTPEGQRLLSAASTTLLDELDQRLGPDLTQPKLEQLTSTLHQLRQRLRNPDKEMSQ